MSSISPEDRRSCLTQTCCQVKLAQFLPNTPCTFNFCHAWFSVAKAPTTVGPGPTGSHFCTPLNHSLLCGQNFRRFNRRIWLLLQTGDQLHHVGRQDLATSAPLPAGLIAWGPKLLPSSCLDVLIRPTILNASVPSPRLHCDTRWKLFSQWCTKPQ